VYGPAIAFDFGITTIEIRASIIGKIVLHVIVNSFLGLRGV
jgi:hypothetical protein